jgi:hypothetical protein
MPTMLEFSEGVALYVKRGSRSINDIADMKRIFDFLNRLDVDLLA